MRVAFATTDGENINEHFGRCIKFAIYDITMEGYRFIEMVETPSNPEEEVDRINEKISALGDSVIVYCEAIGPNAAARVVQSRIHPIKVPKPRPIAAEADALVSMLRGNPPPWIKRIIAREME